MVPVLSPPTERAISRCPDTRLLRGDARTQAEALMLPLDTKMRQTAVVKKISVSH